MKKLMTSTIILLPLLILAIMLTSGAIMSLIRHIYVESVEFVENDTLILVMEDETAPPAHPLEVTVLPLKAGNRDLVFTVEDEKVATVDENGVVSAKFYGETYVTVTSKENKAASDKRKIRVTDKSVHAVELKEYNAEMYRGESQRLLAEVLPREANNKTIVWESSDEGVLSVTQSGEVSCKGVGTVTVTASSAEKPEIAATATIVCCEPLVSISAKDTPVVTAQKTAQFPEIVPYPSDATYEVEYSVSDPTVASVDGTGAIAFHRAGPVTVTATARDGRGNSDSVSVKYDCTYGYYMGALFGSVRAYTFDYDEIAAAGNALGIVFVKDPADSYREIVSVAFDRDDLIEYDEGGERFLLKDVGDETALGRVTITVHARKYDRQSGDVKEFADDVCTVEIVRKTSALSFIADGEPRSEVSITSKSVNLSELAAGDGGTMGVRATPANHTDTLSYSVDGDGSVARLEGETLVFTREGTATVSVAAGTASAELKVTYTQPSLTDKTLTLNEENAEQNIALSFTDAQNCEKAVLLFGVPEGYTAKIASGDDSVAGIEDKKIVPRKGGFADVTISFLREARTPAEDPAGQTVYTIHVFVDKPMEAADISFSANGKSIGSGTAYTTSKTSLTLTVTLNAPFGAMEGKELFFGDEKAEAPSEEGDKLLYQKTVNFSGEQTVSVVASVKYGERAADFDKKTGEQARNNCTLRSTDGKIAEGLTVKQGETLFAASGNRLSFPNIGEKTVLTVDASSPEPEDFVLTREAISFSAGTEVYLKAEISVGENNTAEITLEALKGTYGAQTVTLTVAGHTFAIAIEVAVPADELEVKYGASSLEEGETYSTLLPSLTFTVRISRKDKAPISDESQKVEYSRGGQTYSAEKKAGSYSFTVSHFSEEEIVVTSGLATFRFRLKKSAFSELALSYHLEYQDNGHPVALDPFTGEEGTLEYFFPRGLRNFEICVTLPEDPLRLGGFGDDADESFAIAEEEWTGYFDASTGKLYVEVPAEKTYFYDERITFRCAGREVELVFNCPGVMNVEMAGFDNKADAYKGYQQVRVFAKQSDYGGTETDYFRIPFTAYSEVGVTADPGYAVWNLTRVNDLGGETQTVTKQCGEKVVSGGKTYTIVNTDGRSKLMDGDTVIAQNGKYAEGQPRVTWVDVFAEEGYAHLYFGDFQGLAESDVQNDFFGNFGEKADWEPVRASVPDESGRTFTPTQNAYCYLRAEAGDGAPASAANRHFNFNVLEGGDLFNVFDAAGYYAHDKVVLHSDLYGPGELDDQPELRQKAEESGLFLNETTAWNVTDGSMLGKALLYGNGNQVSLQAKNLQLIDKVSGKNNSYGVNFGNIYNVTVKGANPEATINVLRQKIVLSVTYAYYCDLQYYTKGRPNGKTAYLKNTVLRHASQEVFQLYYKNESAYLENVVITDTVAGLTMENANEGEMNYYFRGFLDVLNHVNKKEIMSLLGDAAKGMESMIGTIVNEAEPYMEWFGKDNTELNFDTQRYANLVIYVYGGFLGTARTKCVNYWDGEKYVQVKSTAWNAQTEDKIGLKTVLNFLEVVVAWGYQSDNSADGGIKGENGTYYTRDMKELFTPSRYIRLLCQYKTSNGEELVENTSHIMWHIQQVFRDPSLIADRTQDHIADLKHSLDGVVWPDGTTPADAAAAEIRTLLSQTVLPEKKIYA